MGGWRLEVKINRFRIPSNLQLPTSNLVRAAFIAIVLAALLWFARTLNWAEAWRAVKGTSIPVLIAAALVNLVSLVLKAVRWWVFLRAIDIPSFGLALRATFAGAALNNILVANSGEPARALLVARVAQVPSEKVFATLALDRLFEMVGYFIMLALSVSLLTVPERGNARWIGLASLAGIAAFLWFLVRHPADVSAEAIEVRSFLQRARRYGRNFFRAMASVSTGPRFAASLGITMAIWLVQVATYHLTAMAAHFDISLVGTIAGLLAVNLGFAARATPGNVGVFQMMYAVSAAAFGMNKDHATGVAFLIQIQQIVPVTIIGLLAAPGILAIRGRESRPVDPSSPRRTPGEA